MGYKASRSTKTVAKGLTVKFVKKANMWCVTFPREGKTIQEWFAEKPTEEQINKIKESINE